MFGKREPRSEKANLANLPNTPPSVYEEAAASFAEIYGSAKVEAARWFLIALAAIALALAAVIGTVSILPLKEIRPWVVEINGVTGVVNKPVEILKVDPNLQVVKSELAKWVESIYTIDPLRTSEALRWANARTADKATSQFAEFRAREKIFNRINREPTLVREARVTAIDISPKGTAFVFVTTTERTGATADVGVVKRWRVTLNYRFSAATQERELLANPLGLLVTYFSDVEERAQ